MEKKDTGVSTRGAGARIAEAGLVDDVKRVREEDLSARRGHRDEPDDDTDLVEDDDEDLDDDEDYSDNDDDTGEEDDDGSADDDSDEDDSDDDKSRAKSDLDAEYTVKIDGKTHKVTAKELVAGYQRGRDYQNKTTALAEHRRNLTASHTQVAEDYDRRLRVTNGILQRVRDVMIGGVDNAQMQQLQREDPGQWAVARQQLSDRVEKINAILAQVQQEQERHVAGLKEQQATQFKAALPYELEALERAIPGWQKHGARRLAEYLTGAGFGAAEIDGVHDSRMLIIAEKARLYDAMQAAGKRARGKSEKKQAAPKRPNKSASANARPAGKQTQRSRAYRDDRAKLKKTGDMRDAGRAISRLLDR